jgi:hypothetical protein
MNKPLSTLLITAGLGLVLPACGQLAAPQPDGTSGVQGRVTQGPMCPGPSSTTHPCPDQPYLTGISVRSGSTLITHFSTRQDGTYSVALAPGTYAFVPDVPAGGFPHAAVADVTVQAKTFTTFDLVYDTGLR